MKTVALCISLGPDELVEVLRDIDAVEKLAHSHKQLSWGNFRGGRLLPDTYNQRHDARGWFRPVVARFASYPTHETTQFCHLCDDATPGTVTHCCDWKIGLQVVATGIRLPTHGKLV